MADICGFLSKLSPKIFVGYQQRYVLVTDGGKVLAYFKNGPEAGQKMPDEEPRGVINIAAVLDIKILNGTDFSLITTDRDYTFRAPSAGEKDRWVKSLRILISSLREQGFSKEDEASKANFTSTLQAMVSKPSAMEQLTAAFSSVVSTNVKVEGSEAINVSSVLSRIQVAEAKGLVPSLAEAAGGSIRTAMLHMLTGSASELERGAETGKRRLLVLISNVGIATENPDTISLKNPFRDQSGNRIEVNSLAVFASPEINAESQQSSVQVYKLVTVPEIEELVHGFVLRLVTPDGSPEGTSLMFDSRDCAETWRKAIRAILEAPSN